MRHKIKTIITDENKRRYFFVRVLPRAQMSVMPQPGHFYCKGKAYALQKHPLD